jgi:hypothetical protein
LPTPPLRFVTTMFTGGRVYCAAHVRPPLRRASRCKMMPVMAWASGTQTVAAAGGRTLTIAECGDGEQLLKRRLRASATRVCAAAHSRRSWAAASVHYCVVAAGTGSAFRARASAQAT